MFNINNLFLVLLASLLLAGVSCETTTYQGGERLYKTMCANCHMDSGEGLGTLIPPLAGSDYLGKNLDKLPCIVRYGLRDSITVNGKIYGENMAGMPGLSDIQITNLLNYINSAWGNNNPPYSFEEVQRLMGQCNN
jgi:mono/diheme cytochrome c family protein